MTLSATTVCYSFPNDCRYRYLSFTTYKKAIEAIEMFKKNEVKAELKNW